VEQAGEAGRVHPVGGGGGSGIGMGSSDCGADILRAATLCGGSAGDDGGADSARGCSEITGIAFVDFEII
jgi:hypothetical protein